MTSIQKAVTGMPASDGAGVKLKRVLGQPSLKYLDPFLMLDEFGSEDAQDYIAGFPEHPHRGFQTVTYMLNGKMGHKDSVGNVGLIEDGGLQWMNAGRGIIHEEMPQQVEGKMRGFQLWVNLPSSEKMSEPAYHDVLSSDIPEVQLKTQGKTDGLVRILAGNYNGIEGAVNTQAVKPLFLDVHLQANAQTTIDLTIGHNGFVYVYEGGIEVCGQILTKGQLGVLDISHSITAEAIEAKGVESKFILLTGKPIGEPIAQYGPFVMNTQAEINQALQDYRQGVLAY